jgi:hypothetical protein
MSKRLCLAAHSSFSNRHSWLEPTAKVQAYVERLREPPTYQAIFGGFDRLHISSKVEAIVSPVPKTESVG